MAKWLGPGVYSFGGKDYKVGDEMPKGVDKETLAALTRKGKVGDAVPQAPAAGNDDALERAVAAEAQVVILTEQLKQAKEDYQRASDAAAAESVEMGKLQVQVATLTDENNDLATQLVQAQATITELTNSAMSAAGPVKGGK